MCMHMHMLHVHVPVESCRVMCYQNVDVRPKLHGYSTTAPFPRSRCERARRRPRPTPYNSKRARGDRRRLAVRGARRRAAWPRAAAATAAAAAAGGGGRRAARAERARGGTPAHRRTPHTRRPPPHSHSRQATAAAAAERRQRQRGLGIRRRPEVARPVWPATRREDGGRSRVAVTAQRHGRRGRGVRDRGYARGAAAARRRRGTRRAQARRPPTGRAVPRRASAASACARAAHLPQHNMPRAGCCLSCRADATLRIHPVLCVRTAHVLAHLLLPTYRRRGA